MTHMRTLVSLVAGIVFGIGLTVSDMVNPARVLNFFDVAGTWDPTLAFVMGGALLTAVVGFRLALARKAPVADSQFHLPQATAIDSRLLAGSALFGVGWGIGGFCPGPALAALVALEPKVYLFVGAMLAGMLAARMLRTAPARNESFDACG